MNTKDKIQPFIDAIMSLESKEEIESFFADICSENELIKLSRRVQVDKQIIDGCTYRQILDNTHSSNISISRIKSVIENDDGIVINANNY